MWRDWLVRAAAGSPSQLQVVYGVAGERRLPESVLGWLPGLAASRPGRIGNDAAEQFQLDVYGEVVDTVYQAHVQGIVADHMAVSIEEVFLEFLEGNWERPDDGIWEVRGGRQHFTHSKVLAWVAADRAAKLAASAGGGAARWRALGDAIHADVCARGVDEHGVFVQSYGSSELDAATLMIPLVGFLPAHDPRVVATVDAVARELSVDGFLLRYSDAAADDGLPSGEGTFLLCSFWLADALALMGRQADAEALFRRLVAVTNDVGLLAEEYDPRHGRLLGNFPQAFSHIALIGTAVLLEMSAREGPPMQMDFRHRPPHAAGTGNGGDDG